MNNKQMMRSSCAVVMQKVEQTRNDFVEACTNDCMAQLAAVLTIAKEMIDRKLTRMASVYEQPEFQAKVDGFRDRMQSLVCGTDLPKVIIKEMHLVHYAVERRIGFTSEGQLCECPFDREQLEHDVKNALLSSYSLI
jgi:hypothetical protein